MQMTNSLRDVVLEIESHADGVGWDSHPSVFALVPTRDLVDAQPELGAELGATIWTPVEQEGVPPEHALEDFLSRLGWPETVAGCAVVMERLMLPARAEESLPVETTEVRRAVQDHPDRMEMRIAAAVLRDGSRHCVARVRGVDGLYEGPDLVPSLTDVLFDTLAD